MTRTLKTLRTWPRCACVRWRNDRRTNPATVTRLGSGGPRRTRHRWTRVAMFTSQVIQEQCTLGSGVHSLKFKDWPRSSSSLSLSLLFPLSLLFHSRAIRHCNKPADQRTNEPTNSQQQTLPRLSGPRAWGHGHSVHIHIYSYSSVHWRCFLSVIQQSLLANFIPSPLPHHPSSDNPHFIFDSFTQSDALLNQIILGPNNVWTFRHLRAVIGGHR